MKTIYILFLKENTKVGWGPDNARAFLPLNILTAAEKGQARFNRISSLLFLIAAALLCLEAR